MPRFRSCWAATQNSLLRDPEGEKESLTLPGRITWTVCLRIPTVRPRCCGAWRACSGMGGWRTRGISPSCRSTRASSIPPVHRSRPIRCISIPRTSSGSPSKAAATRSHPHSACWRQSAARKYAHKIPFIVKFNHNELLTYPNKFDQVFFAQVRQAWDLGAVAVSVTIYFGSAESAADYRGQRGV